MTKKSDPRELQLHQFKGAVEVPGTIGDGLDKFHERALQTAFMHKGAKEGLRAHAKKLASVHAFADKEFEEGTIDADGLALAKRYTSLCITAAENFASYAESQELVENGKEAAFRNSLELAQKFHDMTKRQFDRYNAPIDPDEDTDEREPRRGRQSVAERKAEEAAAKTPKKRAVTKKRTLKKRKQKEGANGGGKS
jgi:hypothetical protein